MVDFANFDRQESYFRPCQSHLDVFARFRWVDTSSINDGQWSYKIKIFCSVPVILFQCKPSACNILMHLNMPLLRKLGATSWLNTDQLTFMLLLSDGSRAKKVVFGKTIRIAKADSDVIRKACRKQHLLTSTQIENMIDILYQLEISNIWPGDI